MARNKQFFNYVISSLDNVDSDWRDDFGADWCELGDSAADYISGIQSEYAASGDYFSIDADLFR